MPIPHANCAVSPDVGLGPAFGRRAPPSPGRRAQIPISILAGLFRAFEFLIVLGGALGLCWPHIGPTNHAAPALELFAFASAFTSISFANALGLYSLPVLLAPRGSVAHLLLTPATGLVLAAAGLCLVGMPDLGATHVATWYLLTIVGSICARCSFGTRLRRWAQDGRLQRRAIIFGAGDACRAMIASTESDPTSAIRIVGIFDDRTAARDTRLAESCRPQGNLDQLIACLRRDLVDLIIVAFPIAAQHRLNTIAERFADLPVDLKLPASSSKLRFSSRTYSRIGPLVLIDLLDRPLTDRDSFVKSAFDRFAAALLLILLSPALFAIAVAIKLTSPGPVLFRQKRLGFNNQLVEIFKFRSMHADRCDSTAARLVSRDDSRVTAVGRFIRTTSLDELPQLFNVLFGDLSLVGPRPHALQAKAADRLYPDVVHNYCARHRMKPGITGWAQIHGWRGETDTREKLEKRVEHDLYYIENWSLLLDLKILLRTPLALIKATNAY